MTDAWEAGRPFDRGELPKESEAYVLRLETAVDRLARSACGCLGTRDCEVYFEDEGGTDSVAACRECIEQQKARAMG